jgi:hypothetical protein
VLRWLIHRLRISQQSLHPQLEVLAS